ncbi:hypothetical protein HRbin19_00263 [bacterium HR19]|nr:hypothetical protein HRbin19_00263 [bacterium HR19]
MDVFIRRILANTLDRSVIIYISALISLVGKINFLGFILMFLFFDFTTSVMFRWAFERTPGDIIFGIRISKKKHGAIHLKLALRWIMGFISPLTGFLLHIPAGNWRSLCDTLAGIQFERV